MSVGRRLSAVAREPTLHFVLLAGVLFALSAAVRGRSRAHVIEIDPADVAARVARLESTAGVRLDARQRRLVEDDYIDERVLAREARAMGLDDDAQVENLLAQKMLDVLSADVIQPTDAELSAYYAAHQGRYASPARATLEEIVVPGEAPLPPELRAQLGNRVPAAELTGVELAHDVLAEVTRTDLARAFGDSTAERVFAEPPGTWVGPRPSVRGRHWLRVREMEAATSLPLDSLRDQVRRDWLVDEEQARLHRRVRELRERYAIVFLDGTGAR